jgi:hypothetical protein
MSVLALLLVLAQADEREFFESRIRPVLAQECYACHAASTKKKGGLTVDTRDGLLRGGRSGPAVVPGKPAESLLLKTIRHEDPELKMPRDGAKLDAAAIRDFEAWIGRGAFDPRDAAPSKEEVARETSFDAILRRRKTWWSFQPVGTPAVPDVPGVTHPVDRFLVSRFKPAPEADPRIFARRCHLLLVGLPPTPEEVEAFVADHAKNADDAVESLVDRLLASPRFGERWARHWMDVMRYAETHGSEGDPAIPHAGRYRDYLIRAFNADVPYARFVREQIAGDLIENPRVVDGVNESALGTGHLRMVLHGFSPTDSLDELVTFTDNQIDTVTKAFLGLTVSCARCHDHKFDAISQADFTSLYGIFASTRPAVIDVNVRERQTLHVDRVAELKKELRVALAARWLGSVDQAVQKLRDWSPDPKKPVHDGPLAAWARLSKKTPEQWAGEWKKLQEQDADRARRLAAFRAQPTVVPLDLKSWSGDGAGLAQGPSPAGEFTLHADGDLAVSAIHPAGILSHRTTDKHRAMLTSPRFKAEGGKLWIRLRGDRARARYVVQNYPRSGTIHFKSDVSSETDVWVGWSLEYWTGDRLHLEISTQADPPLEGVERGRSWFGASEVLYARDPKLAPPPGLPSLSRLGDAADPDALAARYGEALRRAIEEWRDGRLDDDGADFLSAFLRFFPNKAADFPLIQEYRRLEKEIPEPSRAPGVLEGFGTDEPLFVRGDHKHPAQIVPRRFLEAIDPAPYRIAPGQSGRLELADSLVSSSNPFFARVIVNRLWQHLFGRGLVATPDNFGRLGDPPTHPELLDHLARRFLDQGGSMKSMIRYLATSQAFRRASGLRPEDPENLLLSFFPARRLEAEAIRDSMVMLSGNPDLRRSIYLRVVRNNLDPFLTAFDFPIPSGCRGRRDSTNVPAQSLGLMNGPSVSQWAEEWSRRHAALDPDAAVSRLFAEAYGRGPTARERELARAHVAEAGLKSLALALINTKEFIYVR